MLFTVITFHVVVIYWLDDINLSVIIAIYLQYIEPIRPNRPQP
jgi:hypothetical protein